MTTAIPKAEDLFGGAGRLSKAELARRWDEYVDVLNKTDDRVLGRTDWQTKAPHRSGERLDLSAGGAPARTPLDMLTKAISGPELAKSMSAEALGQLTTLLESAKAEIPDLVKDLTTTSPLSTGLVVFDLETGAKLLTPKPTPLRNTIPREQGYGLAHRFKRITGFTGTGTGGVGVIRPGIADTTQTRFDASGSTNALWFNRGGKIAYAGDETVAPYIQFSASDEVNWSAQYSSRGFQDLRALSRQALIWASMLLEERILLYGRGTQSPYSGTLAAPTGVSGTARAAVAGEIGVSGVTTNVFVRVVAEMGDFGVSQASAATGAVATTNGQVVDVTYTLPAGATGARMFVSTGAADPGDASRWLYVFTNLPAGLSGGRSGYNKITIQGALPISGTVPTAWPNTIPGGAAINLTTTDGGSAVTNEYDGVLAYCTGANAGSTVKINTTFDKTNPGVEYQNAFIAMYEAVKASPDRILFSGSDRKQLSDAVKGSANSNYGIRLMQDDITGVTLGTVAASILNEVTGDEVNIQVHPWLPQGNSLILSDTLPIPDTSVDSVFKVFNVQDLMGIDWPVNQFTFDASSYWFGNMVCYAPAWLASVVGIQRV